jgi:hypothetical protein
MLSDKTWAKMRAELWHDKSSRSDAVGYRFAISGRWAEPDERLEDRDGFGDAKGAFMTPEIDTSLKDSVGHDCGSRRISFQGITTGTIIGRRPHSQTPIWWMTQTWLVFCV